MDHIGQKIKDLRKKADLTQDRLADYLGVSAQAVSKWELGVSHTKSNHHQNSRLQHLRYYYFTEEPMKKLKSCEFNLDTNCVELTYTDGTMLAIDTIAIENEYAGDMYQRSELDWLIYNAPLEYADLVLNGDVEGYLKRVTQYRPLDELE